MKTNVTSTADATSAGSGAGIAVIVVLTSSQAFVDSTAATTVTGKSLTVSADTDNSAPTTGTSSPKGASENDGSANSPTQKATTKIAGDQNLPNGGTVTVATTGGFKTDGGTFTVDGGTGTCAYTGVTATSFTGVSGCTGAVSDGAQVSGSSRQSAGAAGQADNQSKTSDGNQNLSAALAVVVLVATTEAYIAPTSGATSRSVATSGGANKVHAGTKNAVSAIADAGKVSVSPAAPTLTAGTGGSLAAGTYYYKVTAVVGGVETLASPEAHVAVAASGKVDLSWTAVDGATSYKVYRGTTADTVGLVGSPSGVSFSDDGSATPGAAPPTSDSSSGVGIGVSVLVAVVNTRAYLAKNVSMSASSLTVETTTNGGQSSYQAQATSGAGGSGNGTNVAGSLAVNIVVATSTAQIQGVAAEPVAVNGADVTLSAASDVDNKAVAKAKKSGGKTTGVGASVALNVVNDTTTAGLADGSQLAGADDLTLTASSKDAATTTAEGGAEGTGGSASVSAQVAITVSNVSTSASIGTGDPLTVGGKLTASATQDATATSTATGAADGGNAVVGAAIVVSVANHLVDAQTKRNLVAGGDVSFTASGRSVTVATGTASAKGAKGEGSDTSGKNSNQKADAQLDLGNQASQNSSGKNSGTSTTPKNGTAEGGSGSSVSVAAAIVFNIVTARTIAFLPGVDVVSTNGGIALHSLGNADASATADGKASNGGTATVGAAVAVNLVKVTNQSGADPESNNTSKNGLSAIAEMLTAGASSEKKHSFKAQATAGAGGGGTVGVAGAVALNIVDLRTLAMLGADPARGPPSVTATDSSTGNIVLKADSSAENEAIAKAHQEGGGGTVGVGASVAINLVNDSTLAGLQDAIGSDAVALAAGAVLTNVNDVTISATQVEKLTTTAEGGAGPAAVAINPNVAIVIANLVASASIGRGADIGSSAPATGTHGSIDAVADQSVTSTTSAKGAVTAGSDTDVGIALSLALAIVDASADSSSKRDLHAAGAVGFQARANVTSTADADAAAKGAKKDSEDVNQKADKNLGDAKTKQTTNTGKSTSKSETPKSSTGDGTTVSVAGSVAINLVTTSSTATLRDGSTVRSDTGAVTLKTSANTDVSSKAKGDTAVDASVGVGAGVAINSVDVTNRASTGTATIDGTGLEVSATMRDVSGDHQHLVNAEAYAGSSKASDVGIAGALALNIVAHHTEAVVASGATVTLSGGALTLSAASDEKDVAKASGKVEGSGSSVGVGAAVALNILIPTVVRAEAVSGSAVGLTSGTTVSVTATGARTVETSVEAGTEGGTAVTPAVALVLMKDDAVTARLASSEDITASGAATITATHTLDVSKTIAKAEAASDSAAIGADIAMNIVLEWSTTAEVAATLTAGSIAVTAASTTNSSARADASATGADSGDSDADKKKQDQVDNNTNTQGKTGTLPTAKNGDGTNGGTDAGNSKTGSEGGDSNSGSVGVAAAISLNWVVTTNTAKIAPSAHLTGSSGQVAVSAQNSTDATAKATGLAYSIEGTHVAAAVGVNFADVENVATVGQDAVVTGTGLVVEAVNTAGQENDFVVWGLAAAGGASQDKGGASVAASIGVQVVFFHTQASVGKGAHLVSNGKVDVVASNKLGVQNLALAGGGSAGGAAVGGAIAVNVFPDVTTEAFIDSDTGSHITQVDALLGTTVSATSALVEAPAITIPVVNITLPLLSSVALAGGVSTGGAAVSGSIIVDVYLLTTQAYVAGGSRLNQHPERLSGIGGAGQTLTVAAMDDTSITNLAGGLNFSSSGAGVGVGIDVDVIEKKVWAWIAPSSVVSTAGAIAVTATSTENFHQLAVDFGVSTSNAAVDGSIIVVVLNPSGDAVAKAEVGGTVHAGQALAVTASDSFTTLLLAGGGAISGSSAGVAVSVIVIDRNGKVDAGVAAGANLQAGGGSGLTVSAAQDVDLTLIAVGGAGGNSAASRAPSSSTS